jgi:putative glycosyltransferase (TIGR04372 family)
MHPKNQNLLKRPRRNKIAVNNKCNNTRSFCHYLLINESKLLMFNKSMWKKFILKLKNGDITPFYRALVYFWFKLLGLVFVLPTIIFLWILKPFFWLKVGKIHHGRIGHLGVETELFLRRRQLGVFPDGPTYCFVCDSRGVANRQLLTMFKRVMRIYEGRIFVSIFDGMLPFLKKTPFYQPLGTKNNEYFEFNNGKPSIFFTPEEIQRGRELLKNLNVDMDTENYVCVFARDNAFLKNTMPHNNWSYHDRRNSDIDNFVKAIKFLIEKGLTVIRVGSVVNKPISFSHPRFIDYPLSENQCEFLDIFLIGTCKFFLGASSGICDMTLLFDIPRLNVDMAEFGLAPIGKNCLYIPKKHKFTKTGQYLYFKDALVLKLHPYSRNAQELGLELEENSPEDILSATEEMLGRLEGTFKYSPEEERLGNNFQKLWSKSNIVCRDVPTPIGIEWLKQNKDLYF